MKQLDGLYHFERMDVYRVAAEALVLLNEKRDRLVGMPGSVYGQLFDSATSVVSNIGEACGKGSGADRRRAFAIARGEANEAGAMIEIAWMLKRLDAATHQGLRQRYLRLTWMLTALLRA